MADKEKIKLIIRRSVKPGKVITEAQVIQISDKIINRGRVDESFVKIAANEVVRDSEALTLNAIDMSDINNELQK
jgi:hypothetical protein